MFYLGTIKERKTKEELPENAQTLAKKAQKLFPTFCENMSQI